MWKSIWLWQIFYSGMLINCNNYGDFALMFSVCLRFFYYLFLFLCWFVCFFWASFVFVSWIYGFDLLEVSMLKVLEFFCAEIDYECWPVRFVLIWWRTWSSCSGEEEEQCSSKEIKKIYIYIYIKFLKNNLFHYLFFNFLRWLLFIY